MDRKLRLTILTILLLLSMLLEISGLSFKFGASYAYVVKPLLWVVIGIISFVFFKNSFMMNRKYKSQVEFCVVVATLVYFFIYFVFGYVKGFAYNPYDKSLNGIITNVWTVLPVIITKEYIRYYMISNCGQKRIFLHAFLISFLFTILNINILKFNVYFSTPLSTFEFFIETLFPNLITNLFLTYVAYFSGYGAPIFYTLLPQLAMFILPILPDIDWALTSILNAIVPFFAYVYINYLINKIDKTIHMPSEKTVDIKGWLLMVLLLVIIVSFGLGLFPIQPLVIGSNSMAPKIHKGDIVFVKDVDVNKVKKGDIIRYVLDGSYIVHRVVKINLDGDGNRVFITKGDNNNSIDLYPVKSSQYTGVIKFNVPYIGYPTILLRELLNPNMGKDVKVEKGKTSFLEKKLNYCLS